MKYLRFPVFVFACALGAVHAQDENRPPPPVIPDFSNLDEFIYVPKSTVSLGVRHLSGAKTSFTGGGNVATVSNIGDETSDDIARVYRDGYVLPDARTTTVPSTGNPVQDPSTGAPEPIADDDRTNSWKYESANQLTEQEGFIAFHSYSADIVDATPRNRDAKAIPGLELAANYDMGKILGSRFEWSITAGMSVNDISAQTTGGVTANINTVTDYYNLFGQTPPEPPFTSPTANFETLPNGSSVATNTAVLISDVPVLRQEGTISNNTDVTNRWKLKGSYFTFRAGPTIWFPINERFRASVSLGGALVYVGTNYQVTETFSPDDGPDIVEVAASDETQLLAGYYVDASLQFDLTERAGFYAGAVYQSTGSYSQHVQDANSSYSTKVDLEGQSGLRAGMTIRF